MEKAIGSLVIEGFKGVVTNRSPHIGADQFQVYDNLQTLTPGVIAPRKGMRPIVFTPTITTGTDDVIAMYAFPTATQESVVWEDSAGVLKVGFSPA